MFCLVGSEIRREGLKTNAGLTVSLKAWDAETKVGLNEPWYLFDEGPSCQTSYPGGNRLVAGERRKFSDFFAMRFELRPIVSTEIISRNTPKLSMEAEAMMGLSSCKRGSMGNFCSNTHRPRGLVHRCRLRSSWRCRSRQWLG